MEEKKIYVVAVLVQLIYTGGFIVSKAALNGGMPTTVYVFYRQATSSLCLLPFAVAFESKTASRMSLEIFIKMFLLAAIGIAFSLNMFNLGIKYTSSTMAAAVSNALPVLTFTLAVSLRIESVKLKKSTGIAKVFGIALCLAGVLVLAFYEGTHLKSISHDRPVLHQSTSRKGSHPKLEWITGTLFMILSTVAWALWIILQTVVEKSLLLSCTGILTVRVGWYILMQGPVLKQYPWKLMFSTTCNILGTIQSFFVALVAERDFNKWKLYFDDGLLGVFYNGLVLSGLSFYLQAWCIERKGAVFVTAWQPLLLLATLACSSFFLGETVNLGSILGGLLMVGGLYSVLWGKSKERSGIPTNDSGRSNADEPGVLVGSICYSRSSA